MIGSCGRSAPGFCIKALVVALGAGWFFCLPPAMGSGAVPNPRTLDQIREQVLAGRYPSAITLIESAPGSTAATFGARELWQRVLCRPEGFLRWLDLLSEGQEQTVTAWLLGSELLDRLGEGEAATAAVLRAYQLSLENPRWLVDPTDSGWEPWAPSFSHRDNWLLRRLLTSSLPDQAEQCYRHIARLYDSRSDRYCRQFVTERAAFLAVTGRREAALALLLETTLALDVETGPGLTRGGPQAAALLATQQGYRTGGVSFRTFLRLAHGLFVELDQEARLLDAVAEAIADERPVLQPVMAQLRLRQGDQEQALALWRDYIQNLAVDEISRSFRLAEVARVFSLQAEAVAEFERCLDLLLGHQQPYAGLDVPAEGPGSVIADAALEDPMYRARGPGADTAGDQTDPADAAIALVRARLVPLYRALGRGQQALQVEIDRARDEKSFLGTREEVKEFVDRLRQVERADEAVALVRTIADQADPIRRATLLCGIGDREAAASALLGLAKDWRWDDLPYNLRGCVGAGHASEVAVAWAALNPDDIDVWFWLWSRGRGSSAEELQLPRHIEVLEAHLDARRRQGEVALNWRLVALANLYRQAGSSEELIGLGLAAVAGEPPFQLDLDRVADFERRGRLAPFRTLGAMLLRTVAENPHQVDLARARQALARSPYSRLSRVGQQRRSADVLPAHYFPPLPPAAMVLTSDQEVHALTAHDNQVYAGTPWGVAVFARDGRRQRVLVGAKVTHLVPEGDRVWLGTSDGLYELDPHTLALNQWGCRGPGSDGPGSDGPAASLGEVRLLTIFAGEVWCVTTNTLYRFDPETRRVERLSMRDQDEHRGPSGRCSAVFADGDRLWFSWVGYDLGSDSWRDNPVEVIGVTPKAVIGWVEEHDQVYLIDRDSLALTKVDRLPCERHLSRPVVLGSHGDLVFLGTSHQLLTLNLETTRLSAVVPADKQPLDWGPLDWDSAVSSRRQRLLFTVDWAVDPIDGVALFHGITAPLDPGTVPQVRVDDDLWFALRPSPFSHQSHSAASRLSTTSRGLFRLSLKTGRLERLSAPRDGQTLTDHQVNNLFFDCQAQRAPLYLLTSHGLNRVSLEGQVEQITTANGLATNAMVRLKRSGGQLIAWSQDPRRGHDSIGISIYDSASEIWLPIPRSGLLAHHGGGSWQAWLDQDHDCRDCDRPQPAPIMLPWPVEPMPLLGGEVYGRLLIADRVLYYGEHGAVLVSGVGQLVSPEVPLIQLLPVGPTLSELKREADSMDYGIVTLEKLARYVGHGNPWVTAAALEHAHPVLIDQSYRALLEGFAGSSFAPIRNTALDRLGSLGWLPSAPLFRSFLDHDDPQVRAWVANLLSESREPAAEQVLRELIVSGYQPASWRYGIAPHRLSRQAIALALWRYRNPGDLSQLMAIDFHWHSCKEIFAAMVNLAGALMERPDLVLPLLGEANPKPLQWFVLAGEKALPLLHQALATDDRIICANVARCLGRIGHSSSVEPLVAALANESGLARNDIVGALGELAAPTAMPALVSLYTAIKEEHRPGVMATQVMERTQGEVSALRGLDQVAEELFGLGIEPTGLFERYQECPPGYGLLDRSTILRAAARIGGRSGSQLFRLAASEPTLRNGDRTLAVRALDLPDDQQHPEDIDVLLALLADERQVAMAAAVTLLNYRRSDGVALLLEAIDDACDRGFPGQAEDVFERLLRVRHATQLQPFLGRAKALEQLLGRSNRTDSVMDRFWTKFPE